MDMDLNQTDPSLIPRPGLDSMMDSNGSASPHVSTSQGHTIIIRIQTCVIPTICVFGLLANSLAIRTFLSGNMRKSSCSLYLAAKCLSDNGFLLATAIIWSGRFRFPLFNQEGLCEITVFLTYFCSFLSVWLMAIITCENYIRIAHSFWVNSCCTATRAYIVIGVCMCVGVLLNMFHFWTTGVEYFRPPRPHPPQTPSPPPSPTNPTLIPPHTTTSPSITTIQTSTEYNPDRKQHYSTTTDTSQPQTQTQFQNDHQLSSNNYHNINSLINKSTNHTTSDSAVTGNHQQNSFHYNITNIMSPYHTMITFNEDINNNDNINSSTIFQHDVNNGSTVTVHNVHSSSRGECTSLSAYKDLLLTMTYVDTVITLLLPSIFMLVLVIVILKNVISSIRRRKRLRAGTQRAHGIRRTVTPQAKMTRFLLAVSLIFLILHTPSHVIRIKMTVEFYVFGIPPSDTVQIFHRFFELLYDLNFCNNCIVFLTFGENFRQSFYTIFCQRFKHHKKNTALSQFERNDYLQSEMTELVANPS